MPRKFSKYIEFIGLDWLDRQDLNRSIIFTSVATCCLLTSEIYSEACQTSGGTFYKNS